jgi:hypothetical protein
MPTIPVYQNAGIRRDDSMERLRQGAAPAWNDRDLRNNARIRQQQAEDYTRGMVDRQAALQDRANQQIENRQSTSEDLFSGMMDQYQDDPMFGYLRSAVTNWMQNPGLRPETMRRLRGQARARAAADLASRQRGINQSASRYGLRGAQVEDSRWAARSRSNAGLNRALLDIDLNNEQMQRQGRAQAIGAGGALMQNYWGNLRGMGGAYANLMTSYNPQVAPMNVYDAMQNVYANPYYGTQGPAANPYAFMAGDAQPAAAPTNGPENWGYAIGRNGPYSIDDGGVQAGLPDTPPPDGNPVASDMYRKAMARLNTPLDYTAYMGDFR